MHFAVALSAVLLPLVANAQYGYAPPSPSSSSSSSAPAAPSAPPSSGNQINVDVFPTGQFIFNPANITAPVGTLVTFYFPTSPITHSVTQSSFADPCTYLAANGSNPAGFDSGLTSGTQFTINITDASQPIWFHCKQITHCGMGMVGSINAPTNGSNTFDAFQAAAKAIGTNEVTETDSGFVSGGLAAVATASPANTATTTSGSSQGSGGGGNAGFALAPAGFFSLAGLAMGLTLLL